MSTTSIFLLMAVCLVSSALTIVKPMECGPTYCKADPCIFSDPALMCSNYQNVECRANYCNGCNAEFWSNGVLLHDCFDLTQLGK